ncbi:(2Fe-2S)-binding protein [Streptomyces sp. JJ66]|uniref:(2Fe-2S)-binding protein n=1 Tax=Streptomyces sp. JJ66 TaxID=2803843 RepID=UPI001C5A2122|nr:(2Fe-2S)-binding protein [Streptomyces sp. JJ66]MBW1603203.1 (2Fe-2S)-binding protein [Streptomyces sp. JJ66]
MSNEPHADPSAPPHSVPPQGGWGGEYDGDATAFIQLPPHLADTPAPSTGYPEREPLAAPGTGQGWEPPVIPPPTPAATTDPTDTGHWTLPFAAVTDEPLTHETLEGGYTAAEAFGQPPAPPEQAAPAGPGLLGQGAAAALAGSHEARLHADAGVVEPEVGEPWTLAPAGPDAPAGLAAPPAPAAPAPGDLPGAPGWPGDPALSGSPGSSGGRAFSGYPGFPGDPAAPGAPDEPGASRGAAAGGADADGAESDTADPAAAEPLSAESPPALTPDAAPEPAPHDEHPLTSYTLRVNGAERHVADVWIGESLLYVLRERLGLAGAKDGCSQGECGACSVQVDGRLVASCLVPAALAEGSEIRTVEGLAEPGDPSDVQRALAEHTGVQCGFCLPGMAMTVHDLLEGNHAPTGLQVRTALCGNLCRCSGYRGVLDAVREVAAERAERASQAARDAGEGTPRIPHQAGPGDEGGTQ